MCDGVIHCPDASDEICKIKTSLQRNSDVIPILQDDKLFCLGHLCPSGECIYPQQVNDLLPYCPGYKADDVSACLRLRFHGDYLASAQTQVMFHVFQDYLFVFLSMRSACLTETKLDILGGAGMGLTSETALLSTVLTVTNAQRHTASHSTESVTAVPIVFMRKTKFRVMNIFVKGYFAAQEQIRKS